MSTNALVQTRISRIIKKSKGISDSKTPQTALPHDITIEAIAPQELSGFILAIGPDSITMRHKRGAGSSKQIVSTFPNNTVLQRVGEANDYGQVTVVRAHQVFELKGQLVEMSGDTILATDIQTGEVTHINTAIPGHTVSMVVDEVSAAKKYDLSASTKKSPKAKAAKSKVKPKAKK